MTRVGRFVALALFAFATGCRGSEAEAKAEGTIAFAGGDGIYVMTAD